METLEYILSQLKGEHISTQNPQTFETFIMPGNKAAGWLGQHIEFKQQLILHAIVNHIRNISSDIEEVENVIRHELRQYPEVKVLSYLFRDVARMYQVIDEFAGHFKLDTSAKEITRSLQYRFSPDELHGYFIITMVRVPILK